MTEEQFNKAIEINDRLAAIEALTDELDKFDVRLCYVHWRDEKSTVCSHQFDEWTTEEDIKAILNKHDKQIREEIRAMFDKTKKEIEAI